MIFFQERYIQRIEQEADKVRADYEARILDLKSQLADLKFDKSTLQARIAQLEAGASVIGKEPEKKSPRPDFGESFEEKVITPWQATEAAWEKMQNEEAPVAQGA